MTMLTRDDIARGLRDVVGDDDTCVLLHANVFSFGRLADPQGEILAGIDLALGPARTLIMPAFTFAFCKSGSYHWQTTPSETGVLTEYFRHQPGVVRTRCPINSFLVRGPQAPEFLAAGMGSSCWGQDSIYELLRRKNVLVVGLGEPLSIKSSIFHYAEEAARVPYRYFKTFRGTADFGEGPQAVSQRMYVRRVDVPVVYDYAPVIERIKEQGGYRHAALGGAYVESIHAAQAVEVLVQMLSRDPLAVLSSRAAYDQALARQTAVFFGSSNLEPLGQTFAQEYEAFLKEECRIVPVPFGQYRQKILDPESDLRVADPDLVVFLERAEDLLGDLLSCSWVDPAQTQEQISARITAYGQMIRQARGILSGRFLVADFEAVLPSPLGNADPVTPGGTAELIAEANAQLRRQLADLPDVVVLDMRGLIHSCGRAQVANEKLWYMGRIPFAPSFARRLARKIIGVLLAHEGRTARLIVTDLDNTLWGGVIGDDGMEGIQLGSDHPGNVYRDLQECLLAFSRRGIALAISSKNTAEIALRAIREHPQMILREKDFAGLRINWEDKASQIRELCAELGLGLYSVMFIDDNPAEREWVRRNLPECVVPELPANPSAWVRFLLEHPFLESGRLTREDLGRVKAYQNKAQQEQLRGHFERVEDFLASLSMRLSLQPYGPPNAARIEQLLMKTNQFNTTTRRYGQAELSRMIARERCEVYGIHFRDRFFEPETIGVLILRRDGPDRMEIDDLLLSCRVLGRDIETAVLGWACTRAREHGCRAVRGAIVPTPKNQPVADLYSRHGFSCIGDGVYELALSAPGVTVPGHIQLEAAGVPL